MIRRSRMLGALCAALLFPFHPAQLEAAETSVTVLANGSYPTAAPSSLSANAVIVGAGYSAVDVEVITTAGSGTLALLCYKLGSAKWWPVGDITVDSSSYGGGGSFYSFARFSPGAECNAYALWVKTAGATVSAAYISTGVNR